MIQRSDKFLADTPRSGMITAPKTTPDERLHWARSKGMHVLTCRRAVYRVAVARDQPSGHDHTYHWFLTVMRKGRRGDN